MAAHMTILRAIAGIMRGQLERCSANTTQRAELQMPKYASTMETEDRRWQTANLKVPYLGY